MAGSLSSSSAKNNQRLSDDQHGADGAHRRRRSHSGLHSDGRAQDQGSSQRPSTPRSDSSRSNTARRPVDNNDHVDVPPTGVPRRDNSHRPAGTPHHAHTPRGSDRQRTRLPRRGDRRDNEGREHTGDFGRN